MLEMTRMDRTTKGRFFPPSLSSDPLSSHVLSIYGRFNVQGTVYCREVATDRARKSAGLSSRWSIPLFYHSRLRPLR